MRRRYQKGSLQKVDGVWVARWWEDGRRPARTLGPVSKMSKTTAQSKLAAILAPINGRSVTPSETCSFRDFVAQVFFAVLSPQVEKFHEEGERRSH